MSIAVYHLFLYRQYRERILVAYSVYLLLVFTYICLSVSYLFSLGEGVLNTIDSLREATSVLTIVAYCWFLMDSLTPFWNDHKPFFRVLKIAMMAGVIYALVFIISGFITLDNIGKKYEIIRTAVRCLFFFIGVYAAWVFFPKMKDPFLKLIRSGTIVYMFFTTLIVLSVVSGKERLFGLMEMHWFYIGAFADIFIFSLAMAYKIKQLMMRVMEVRQKISRDLHDDIGASLSSLQIYGAIAEETFRHHPEKAVEMIKKISVQSRKVMDDMADIVWSMKPGGDDVASLETRIKNFGSELLQDKSIQFTYSVAPEADVLIKELQHRRNLLLIVKEAMNNIAKYSNAATAYLKLNVSGNTVLLEVSDDGRGFDMTTVPSGNGLANMRTRVLEMNGEFVLQSEQGRGTTINIKLPVIVNQGW